MFIQRTSSHKSASKRELLRPMPGHRLSVATHLHCQCTAVGLCTRSWPTTRQRFSWTWLRDLAPRKCQHRYQDLAGRFLARASRISSRRRPGMPSFSSSVRLRLVIQKLHHRLIQTARSTSASLCRYPRPHVEYAFQPQISVPELQ